MGRRTSFTPELGEMICSMMRDGATLLEVERSTGVSQSTVSAWGRGENGAEASFAAAYAQARDDGARAEFRQLKDLEWRMKQPRTIETAGEDGKIVKIANPDWLDPMAGRVVIDSMKWRLSKMLPREFGDRVGVEHSGSVEFKPSNAMPEHLGTLIEVAAHKDEDEHTTH